MENKPEQRFLAETGYPHRSGLIMTFLPLVIQRETPKESAWIQKRNLLVVNLDSRHVASTQVLLLTNSLSNIGNRVHSKERM